jgi:hypothetical protein
MTHFFFIKIYLIDHKFYIYQLLKRPDNKKTRKTTKMEAVSADEREALRDAAKWKNAIEQGDQFIYDLRRRRDIFDDQIEIIVFNIITQWLITKLYDKSFLFRQAARNLNVSLIFQSYIYIIEHIDEYCHDPEKMGVDEFPNAPHLEKPEFNVNITTGFFVIRI